MRQVNVAGNVPAPKTPSTADSKAPGYSGITAVAQAEDKASPKTPSTADSKAPGYSGITAAAQAEDKASFPSVSLLRHLFRDPFVPIAIVAAEEIPRIKGKASAALL
jgi:hypothetical protein